VERELLHQRDCTSPRSTGGSPVGATDGASDPLVQKPMLHRDEPGGGRALSGSASFSVSANDQVLSA